MTEVRTTVDDKLISKMSEATNVDEPVKEEVSADPEKTEISKSQDDGVYDIPEDNVKSENNDSADKDEFGNEIVSKKVYTEEEVNELMRQRFNRTKKEESAKPVQNTQPQNESSDDWEAQLEGFVENTVKKLTVKEQQKIQQEREESMQAEFQDKMMRGMGKYKDFNDVVGKMPISDPMLLATRQMKDPAAFIYAASKTQAKELERISQIPDPYYQAAEMGRLEERMRKVRAGTSSPRPVSEVKGDIENKSNIRRNVDELIQKDALKKLSNRRY